MMRIEDVMEVVREYYGDTSRSREDTREGLEELVAEVETLIETLEDE